MVGLLNNPRFRNLIGLHSPSLEMLGAFGGKGCACRRCRLGLWKSPPPRAPKQGPLTLDDAVVAYHDDCDVCDRQRAEGPFYGPGDGFPR